MVVLKKIFVFVLAPIILAGLGYLYFSGNSEKLFAPLRPFTDRLFGIKELTPAKYNQYRNSIAWDYTTQYVAGNVLGFGADGKTLRLSFTSPLNFANKITSEDHAKNVKVTCPKEDTSYYVTKVKTSEYYEGAPTDTKLIQKGVKLFELARVGDTLFGFCADENCDEISKGCELYQTIVQE